MRAIGAIPDEEAARRFAEHLFALKITAEIRLSTDRGFLVWVHRDDQLAQARAELERFLLNPNDETYRRSSELAEALRDEEEEKDREFQKNYRQMTHTDLKFSRAIATPVLIAVAVGIYAAEMMSPDLPIRDWLFINGETQDGRSARQDILPSVRSGEIWRLWTPALLHFTPFHLLFNILGLHGLGSAIEGRIGTKRMIGLVLIVGIASHVSQYFWAGSRFGGLSGVVCGLFGYVWMKSVFDRRSSLALDQRTVVYYLAFLVIAALGYFGPIANVAHFVGLGVGMAIGVAGPMSDRWGRR